MSNRQAGWQTGVVAKFARGNQAMSQGAGLFRQGESIFLKLK
jgi:hypothetical protein